jgi:hypothetical protein
MLDIHLNIDCFQYIEATIADIGLPKKILFRLDLNNKNRIFIEINRFSLKKGYFSLINFIKERKILFNDLVYVNILDLKYYFDKTLIP